MADRFDRFTEHALLTLMLAEEEARRLRHAYIGTEHLLLGLVREGNGVGARMLANLGVELANVRTAVESIVGRGDLPSPAEVEMTPRVARVLMQAQEEAQRLNHDAIGTEHLLLGLTWDADGITAGVLESLGVNPERVHVQMVRLLIERTPSSWGGLAPVDQAARLSELRRSLDTIRRAKDTAITMQEYERIAQISDQEAALVAEIAGIEVSPGAAGRAGNEPQRPAVTHDRLMQPDRALGRTFRDAFDLGLALSPRARALLEGARTQAEMRGQSLIEPEHLLLAIAVPGTVLAREMEQRGIDLAALTRAAERIVSDRLSHAESWPFGATSTDEVR